MCKGVEKVSNRTELEKVNQVLQANCIRLCPMHSRNCPSELWNDKLPNCYKKPFRKEFLMDSMRTNFTPENGLRIITILESLEIMTEADLATIEAPPTLTLKEILERGRHKE